MVGSFIVLGLLLIGVVWIAVKDIRRDFSKDQELDKSTSPPRVPPPRLASYFAIAIKRFIISEDDQYELVGEVKNISSRTFWHVIIGLQFLDKNLTVVKEDVVFACRLDHIRPGETKPFRFVGKNQPLYESFRTLVDDATEIK